MEKSLLIVAIFLFVQLLKLDKIDFNDSGNGSCYNRISA